MAASRGHKQACSDHGLKAAAWCVDDAHFTTNNLLIDRQGGLLGLSGIQHLWLHRTSGIWSGAYMAHAQARRTQSGG